MVNVNDFEVKITKRVLLLEVNNDKCHNWYYDIYGRIYNKDNTRFRKFNFVIWFDAFDLQEYFEGEEIDIRTYIDVLIDSFVDSIKSYDDTKEFADNCKKSIEEYNKSL